MEYRELGRTGWKVSTVSFGAWAIGGTWGAVDDAESMAALHRALDRGVNFFDTADVYGDGRSERLLARLRKERSEPFYIATKAGRRLPPQTPRATTRENIDGVRRPQPRRTWRADAIDLLQLHCPPPTVYYGPRCSGCSTTWSRRASCATTASASRGSRRRSRRSSIPACSRCRSSTTCSASGPRELLFPRGRGAGSACWRACRCRRGCWRAS